MRAPRTNTIGYNGKMWVFYQAMLMYISIIITNYAIASHHLEVTACYENNSVFEMAKRRPRIIDVVTGYSVNLLCNFCKAKEDYYPKLWFYGPRIQKSRSNILTEIPVNDIGTKLLITPFHKLTIYDFNEKYSGIYICKSPEFMEEGNAFMYIIEGIFKVDVSPKLGTFGQWAEYKRNYFDPLNKQLETSEEALFQSLRDSNTTFKLITIWDNWGDCKEFDHQKGVRKRLGRCRLQPIAINTTFENLAKDTFANNKTISYLTDGYDIPCRSLQLNKMHPELSKIVRYIPEYEAQELCHYTKRAAKTKLNKDKRKITKLVEENSHVTLLCSDIFPSTELQWLKDTKVLNSLFRNNVLSKNEDEPHISLDANNSLHILHIRKNEEGNYSCTVNGKKIQEFEVRVVSKSKLLNQEFIRYSIYLGFVLSLSMACYCAGVCVAWHRRSSFVDPLFFDKRDSRGNHRLHCERESLLK
nr:uncharacterized protein LOC110371767 [Helicoverpa armigera]